MSAGRAVINAYDNNGYTGERGGQRYDLGSAGGNEEPEAAPRKPGYISRVVIPLCILVPEVMERMAFYAIIQGLPVYCMFSLGYEMDSAGQVLMSFTAGTFFSSLLWGFISDVFMGKFFAVVLSSSFYVAGLAITIGATFNYSTISLNRLTVEQQGTMYLTGLAVCAVTAGGIKANVAPLAAEQIETLGRTARRIFFHWYYFVINIGSLVATLGLRLMLDNVADYGYGFSLFVPLGALAGAVIIFIAASPFYFKATDRGREWLSAAGICRQGCCKKKPAGNPKMPMGAENGFLANAKVGLGGSYGHAVVDSVESVTKLLPLTFVIPLFWCTVANVSSTFPSQMTAMDMRDNKEMTFPLNLSSMNPALPPNTIVPGFLSVHPQHLYGSLHALSILVFVPVIDVLICNVAQAVGVQNTPYRRIIIGVLLAFLGMITAAVIETRRKEDIDKAQHFQMIGGIPFLASELSALNIIPQFALMGAAEVFVAAASFELAFHQAPRRMRGLTTGIFQAVVAMGFGMQGGIILFTQDLEPPWFDFIDLNGAALEKLYYLMSGIAAACALGVLGISLRCRYADPDDFEERESEKIEMQSM